MIAGAPASPEQINAVLLSEDTRGKREEATRLHYDKLQKDLTEYLQTEVQNPLAMPEDIANVAYNEATRIALRSSSPAATEQAYLEQAAPNAQGSLRDEVAFNMKAYNVLQYLANRVRKAVLRLQVGKPVADVRMAEAGRVVRGVRHFRTDLSL